MINQRELDEIVMHLRAARDLWGSTAQLEEIDAALDLLGANDEEENTGD